MTERPATPAPDDAEVGDPVCWLDQLCQHCGAMVGAGSPGATTCWRCGATQEQDHQ